MCVSCFFIKRGHSFFSFFVVDFFGLTFISQLVSPTRGLGATTVFLYFLRGQPIIFIFGSVMPSFLYLRYF